MLFEEKIPAAYRKAFTDKVQWIADQIDVNPDWIMAVMNKETGGTFSPSIKNPTSSASGLIQFMDSTAKSLGTTTAALRQMTAVDQLSYVLKYFKPYAGNLHSYADTYLAVFYPAGLNKADNWKFPNWVYSANRGLDLNKDRIITIGEFKSWMNKGLKIDDSKKKILPSLRPSLNWVIPVLLVLIIGSSLLLLFPKIVKKWM